MIAARWPFCLTWGEGKSAVCSLHELIWKANTDIAPSSIFFICLVRVRVRDSDWRFDIPKCCSAAFYSRYGCGVFFVCCQPHNLSTQPRSRWPSLDQNGPKGTKGDQNRFPYRITEQLGNSALVGFEVWVFVLPKLQEVVGVYPSGIHAVESRWPDHFFCFLFSVFCTDSHWKFRIVD